MTAMPHAIPFDGAKHRRDHGGRFASGGGSFLRTTRATAMMPARVLPADHGASPSFSSKFLVEGAPPKRSATKGESWQRNGSLHAPAANEIPVGYTGSRDKEHEAGTMLKHSFTAQIPPGWSHEQWAGVTRRLGHVAGQGRKATIEKAMTDGIKVPTHKMSGPTHTTWTPPEGTTKASMNRAYVHAAKIAMHDFGAVDYDFAMDDHLKHEMTPLKPFMRHVHRKLRNDFNVDQPGGYKPFRAAFGQSFPKPKFDRFTGAERLRMRPNQELVKAAGLAALAAPAAAPAAPSTQRMPTPGVIPAAQAQGVSRFARYRALVARNENNGIHDLKPLTPAERMQRVKAAKTWHQDRLSGKPRLQQGMPGSIAGDGFKRPSAVGAMAQGTGARILK